MDYRTVGQMINNKSNGQPIHMSFAELGTSDYPKVLFCIQGRFARQFYAASHKISASYEFGKKKN
jgi:hypothetical protein